MILFRDFHMCFLSCCLGFYSCLYILNSCFLVDSSGQQRGRNVGYGHEAAASPGGLDILLVSFRVILGSQAVYW